MIPPLIRPNSSPRLRWTILLFLALLLGLVACNGNDLPPDDPTPTPEPLQTPEVDSDAEPGGSLVVAIPNEPDSLNFALTTRPSSFWVLSALNARMIRITDDNELQPILLREVPSIENGGISDDGTTYTLRFLPELNWADGERLTARDFVFTWETITDPEFPAVSRSGWDLIEDVTVSSDELSVSVRLSRPSADFTRRVLAGGSGEAAGFLLPAHRFEELSAAEIAGDEYADEAFIGSGPFQLVEWEPGEQLVIERNDEFWGEQPLLDRIVFRFPESPRDAVALVTTGDVDLTVSLPETALLDAIESDETESYITPRAGAVKTYAFNLNDPDAPEEPHPIFSDPDVRRAIVFGFDRQRIVDSILLGQTTVPGSPLSNTVYDMGNIDPLSYGPERAAEMLDDAGWELDVDGYRYRDAERLAFTLTTVSGEDAEALLRQRIQQAFIEDMAEIGVQVEPRNYSEAQLFGTDGELGILAERTFDIVDVPWNRQSALDSFISRFSSNAIPTPGQPDGANVMGYISPDVDRKLARQATILDPAERAEVLQEIQQHLVDDMPIILVYDHIDIDMARVYVQGLRPGPVSGLWWNVETWWISADEVLS